MVYYSRVGIKDFWISLPNYFNGIGLIGILIITGIGEEGLLG